MDDVVIARSIVEYTRDQEKPQTTRTRRRSLWPGQSQNDISGDVRAEPLITPQFPARLQFVSQGIKIQVRLRHRGRLAHVRAPLLFGEEHRALFELSDTQSG